MDGWMGGDALICSSIFDMCPPSSFSLTTLTPNTLFLLSLSPFKAFSYLQEFHHFYIFVILRLIFFFLFLLHSPILALPSLNTYSPTHTTSRCQSEKKPDPTPLTKLGCFPLTRVDRGR